MSSSLRARANPYRLGPIRITFDEKREDGRKLLVVKWPLYVWGIRVCLACAKIGQERGGGVMGQPPISASSLTSLLLIFSDLKRIISVSVAIAYKMVSRWIFHSELWDCLLPALVFAISSHKVDYFIKDTLTSLLFDPMDIEVARAKKERVLRFFFFSFSLFLFLSLSFSFSVFSLPLSLSLFLFVYSSFSHFLTFSSSLFPSSPHLTPPPFF